MNAKDIELLHQCYNLLVAGQVLLLELRLGQSDLILLNSCPAFMRFLCFCGYPLLIHTIR